MANFRKGGAAALNQKSCPPCNEGDHADCWEQAGLDAANDSIAWWEWNHDIAPDMRYLNFCMCYNTNKDRLHPRWEPEDPDLAEEMDEARTEFRQAIRDVTRDGMYHHES